MVKKLLKHEAIDYARTLIIFEIVLFALALSTRIIMFFEYDHWIYYLVQGSSFVAFGLAALACIYLTLAMCIIRFYKNLFSQEGYLSFALPVSTHQHLFVKLFSALVYSAITWVSVVVAFLITISGDILNEVIKAAGYIIDKIVELISFTDGVHIAAYAVYSLILLILSGIFTFLVYYSCITIGQTAKKNRILAAVGCFFAYSFINQVLGTIFSIAVNIFVTVADMSKIVMFIENHTYLCLHIGFVALIVWTLLLDILFYFINYNIISKKLNLE